jgi:hypothetical protein
MEKPFTTDVAEAHALCAAAVQAACSDGGKRPRLLLVRTT